MTLLAIYNRTGAEPQVEGTLTKLEEVVDPSTVIQDSKKTLVEATDERPTESTKANAEKADAPADPAPVDVTAPEGGTVTPEDVQTLPDGSEIPADFLVDPNVDGSTIEDIQGTPITPPGSEPIPESAPVTDTAPIM